ncbi:MAG: HNH endonuclease [Abitibacteriaceae bacterium]|nr:HNH endonuclease [Abditibacteriaceae bacterium]
MTINEAAMILRFNREEVKIAIKEGVQLPKSKKTIQLIADLINEEYDIDQQELDNFIRCFDEEEPGRHPPTDICRDLLIEARHRCAICRQISPIEFHHMIEFSKLKHYDKTKMLALCPTCHTRCTLGQIDQNSQRKYKLQLKEELSNLNGGSADALTFMDDGSPIRFSWDDLKELIVGLHEIHATETPDNASKYDYSDAEIEFKNELNNLGKEYFELIKSEHEPYFGEILAFLKKPINKEIADLYYDIVNELRAKIAADRNKYKSFEVFLIRIADTMIKSSPERVRGRRRELDVLLSFMYVNCDIGRKQ